MKTFIAIASLLLAPSAIATDEVYIQLNNGATRRVFLVKTGETSFGHVEVSGLPGKAGESSVAFNNSVQMVGKEVVLTEKSRSMDKGIVTENTNRRFIPVSRLPWTGKLSGKPVRLFRAKPPKEEAQAPNKSENEVDFSKRKQPTLSIRAAINMAEEFLRREGMPEAKFLARVQYHESGPWTEPNSKTRSSGPCWQIAYEPTVRTDGGQIFVLIYMDGTLRRVGGL